VRLRSVAFPLASAFGAISDTLLAPLTFFATKTLNDFQRTNYPGCLSNEPADWDAFDQNMDFQPQAGHSNGNFSSPHSLNPPGPFSGFTDRRHQNGNFLPFESHSAQGQMLPSMGPSGEYPMSSKSHVYHISMKLFGSNPSDLPPDLRGRVLAWCAEAPMDMMGYIRPGCLHLTVSLTLRDTSAYRHALTNVPRGIASCFLCKEGHGDTQPQWAAAGAVSVWLPDRWMILKDGKLRGTGMHSRGSADVQEATTSSWCVSGGSSILVGVPVGCSDGCQILLRMGGFYHTLNATVLHAACTSSDQERFFVVQLPQASTLSSLAWLEVLFAMSGSDKHRLRLSQPTPVLVTDSRFAFSELAGMKRRVLRCYPGGPVQCMQDLDSLLHRNGSSMLAPVSVAACQRLFLLAVAHNLPTVLQSLHSFSRSAVSVLQLGARLVFKWNIAVLTSAASSRFAVLGCDVDSDGTLPNRPVGAAATTELSCSL